MKFSTIIKEACNIYIEDISFPDDFSEDDKKFLKLYLGLKLSKDLKVSEYDEDDKKVYKALKIYKPFINKTSYETIFYWAKRKYDEANSPQTQYITVRYKTRGEVALDKIKEIPQRVAETIDDILN